MGFLDGLRKLKVPNFSAVAKMPAKAKLITKNNKLSEINVRLWDREFLHPLDVIGEIDYVATVPIVRFKSPKPLSGVVTDGSIYIDGKGQKWIEYCIDSFLSLDRNCDIVQELNVDYYNTISYPKIELDGYKNYLMPVLINRIPRPIIKVNPSEQRKQINKQYVTAVTEVTLTIIEQILNINLLQRVGKKEDSMPLAVLLMGIFLGTIIGIIISFTLLK